MKIEKETLLFRPHFQLTNIPMSELQLQYLPILASQSSIESTVVFFLKQGWLVSFRELYDLVEKLVSYGAVVNPNFVSYFAQLKPQKVAPLEFSKDPFSAEPLYKKSTFTQLPFFRSLDAKLASLLLEQAYVTKVPANSYLCREGDSKREMFVILKGQAAIYRPTSKEQHQFVAALAEGSLFGEAGFFLGTPRSANIVTQQESDVLVIPYRADVLGKYIDKSKAQALQLRFWIQHALQKSALFKRIPADCLDALAFVGQVVKTKPQQLVFSEGSAGTTAYIVIQGSLTASKNNKAIGTMGQGSFFGEISMLLSQGQRTASVQSQQECLLLEITRDEFYKLLSQNLFLGRELEKLAHERLQRDQLRPAS